MCTVLEAPAIFVGKYCKSDHFDQDQVARTDPEEDKKGLKEWRRLKTNVQSSGFPPSRKQQHALKSLFIASLPALKPRFLEKPPERDAFLLAFHEQASRLLIPRRPRRIPPRSIREMAKKAAKKQSGAAEATDATRRGKQDGKQDSIPNAEAGSGHGKADLEEEEASEQSPPSTPKEKPKKAPVANMNDKPTTATKAKGSECDGKETKTGSKRQGATSKSNSTPVPAPAVRPASPKEVSAFMSPIFNIFVGPYKQCFAAHQAIISQSPVLEKQCTAQSAKKGRAKNCLLLPGEKPMNFVALLQYLYTGQVYLNLPLNPDGSVVTDEAAGEKVVAQTARKIALLYAIGADYELEELRVRVTKVLKATKLMEMLSGMEFFELAEKLYPDDPDFDETESFARFFAEHAPPKVRTVPVDRTNDLLKMVSNGGAFAEAIFLAYNMAVRTAVAAENEVKAEQDVKIKNPEEEYNKHKRARDDGDGADTKDIQEGDGHVDKRARVESEMPDDGKTEDLPAEAAATASG